MTHGREQQDPNALNYMLGKFPDAKLDRSRNKFLATCSECGAKKKLWFFDRMPHHGGCFACGFTFNSVFALNYRTNNNNWEQEQLSPIENLVYRYRKETGKNHRLTDDVLKEFEIKLVNIQRRDKQGYYDNLAIPANTKRGYVKHLNYSGRWISVRAADRENEKFLNFHRIEKEARQNDEFTFYVLAGEWDLFAFWKHTGIHGISPLDGETNAQKFDRNDIAFFHNRHVVIFFDNDAPGYKGGRSFAKRIKLLHKVKSLKVVDLSKLGLDGGQDLDDYFQIGGTKERLFEEVEKTPDFNGNLFEADENISGIKNQTPRPNHPLSIFDDEMLNALWDMLVLPAARRDIEMERLAELSGFNRDLNRGLFRSEIDKYKKELESMRYLAYDDEMAKIFSLYHVKQSKKQSEFDDPRYYIYRDGYYQYLNESDKLIICDDIARRITSPDDRIGLSKIRRQALEELNIKLTDAPVVDFHEQEITHINLNNGAYCLKTKKLMPHSHEHLLIYKNPANYNPDSTCQNFDNAMQMSFSNDQDRREMLKGLYYLISGDRSHHKAFWFHGAGNDGKSVFAYLMRVLVGAERTSAVPIETIDKPHATAPLFGKLLNISEEVPDKFKINEAIFKRITGQALIEGNPKNKQQVSFINRALIVVPANSLPYSSDSSYGYNRRFKIFQFKRIQDEDIIRGFEKKLEEEIDGITYKILTQGHNAFVEDDGFVMTDTETIANEERIGMNSVIKYWQDVCKLAVNDIKRHFIDIKGQMNFGDEEKATREAAKLAVTKSEYEPYANDIDQIEQHVIFVKYTHKKKGDILLVNTNKHYSLYRDYFKNDEVNLQSQNNFRKGALNYLSEKFKNRYTDFSVVEIFKKDALVDTDQKKNIALIMCRRKTTKEI